MEEAPMSLIDAVKRSRQIEIRLQRDAVRRQTLRFIADDLRRVAEAYSKSAGIEPRRLYRKNYLGIADVLIGRAAYYETLAEEEQVGGYVSRAEAERIVMDMMSPPAPEEGQ